jgi:hypothetical protein
MRQSDIITPILSYEDINKRAEEFLREHKRNEILPVDIEAIAEFDLGLKILNKYIVLNSALPAYRQAGEIRIPQLDTPNFLWMTLASTTFLK